ncbi:MAG: hypothetical protein ACR2KS_12450 [Candidatus Eremiobacter antarcticus]|nr:hypothetical protein [Candidatus Eremiobacteraeota bacterium]MBC5808553.1 hypothetical protein [Candidatus Eremiobacteraeota bacterium]
MRAACTALCLSIVVSAVATISELRPYSAGLHRWQYTLAVALAGLALGALLAPLLRRRTWTARAAAASAAGGIVTAIAFVAAELLAGPPQRVPVAPGENYRPPHSSLLLTFPAISPEALSANGVAQTIVLSSARTRWQLTPQQTVRIRSYVLRSDPWPAAYVSARSPHHEPETVTQPQNPAFVSPVLQFPSADKDGMLVDQFSVPALHREVSVKYYPNLISRGIDVPFVQFAIAQENGPTIASGVAVSGRPVSKGNMLLTFSLGTYPVVTIAGAPDPLLYGTGLALSAAGIVGFLLGALRAGAGQPA